MLITAPALWIGSNNNITNSWIGRASVSDSDVSIRHIWGSDTDFEAFTLANWNKSEKIATNGDLKLGCFGKLRRLRLFQNNVLGAISWLPEGLPTAIKSMKRVL